MSTLTHLMSIVPGVVRRRTLWYAPPIKAERSLVVRNIQRVVGVSPFWYLCENPSWPRGVVRPTEGYGVLSKVTAVSYRSICEMFPMR